MKKKLLSLIVVTALAVGLTACGGSTESSDSKRVAELEEQIEELQQQLEEAKQGQSAENTNDSSDFDSETQSLIDSINADTAEYQGVCGADAKWYYKDNVLVIKGTGEITDNPWQSDEYSVSSSYFERIFKINWVIIDEGITSIYDGSDNSYSSQAFGNIDELTKVVLPTSLEKIGAHSFDECDNLSNINIPSNVTEIGGSAFRECTSITDIIMPDGVKKINGYTFYHCSSLTSVNLPDGLTTIGLCAFCGCSNLSDIMIPDSITEIGENAFSGCDILDTSTIDKIRAINPSAYHDYSGQSEGTETGTETSTETIYTTEQ